MQEAAGRFAARRNEHGAAVEVSSPLASARVVGRGGDPYPVDIMVTGSSQGHAGVAVTDDARGGAPPAEVQELAAGVASAIRAEIGAEIRVLWFGSWVEGNAVSRSDLDLAVDAGRALTPAERARIDARVDDLPTLRQIDIVDLHGVGARFRRHILEEGRSL